MTTRREILRLATVGGVGVYMSAMLAACHDDATDPSARATIAFDSDRGALNLAYLYAQLMTDFYARVAQDWYVGVTLIERSRIATLRDQKQFQRDAMPLLIPSGRITDAVLFNFHDFDFTTRSPVMSFAQTFEDLGVAAIAGVAASVHDAANLTLLGQLHAVWGRHAAVIRDLNDITAGSVRTSFAASADSRGRDPVAMTSAVLTQMQPYVHTSLSASGAA